MKDNIEVMEGPYSKALTEDLDGVVYREVKTVRVKSGMLTEYVTKRVYQDSGDYNDTSSISPIIKVGS